jgi:hypothetical protein
MIEKEPKAKEYEKQKTENTIHNLGIKKNRFVRIKHLGFINDMLCIINEQTEGRRLRKGRNQLLDSDA